MRYLACEWDSAVDISRPSLLCAWWYSAIYFWGCFPTTALKRASKCLICLPSHLQYMIQCRDQHLTLSHILSILTLHHKKQTLLYPHCNCLKTGHCWWKYHQCKYKKVSFIFLSLFFYIYLIYKVFSNVQCVKKLNRLQASSSSSFVTYSLGAKEVVVKSSEPLPGVVAPIGSTHEVLDDQSDVNQTYAVVGWEVTLEIAMFFRELWATLW